MLRPALFFGLVLCGVIEQAWAEPVPMARAASVRGQVAILRNGIVAILELKAGETLYEGDTLRTGAGALARLLLNDRSLVAVGGDSEVRLSALRQGAQKPRTTIKVTIGRLWARLAAAVRSESVFVVESENAVAGVRGTSFFFEVDDNGVTRISVQRGLVEVRDPTGSLQQLAAMQRSTVQKSGQRVEAIAPAELSTMVDELSAAPVLDPKSATARLRESTTDKSEAPEASPGTLLGRSAQTLLPPLDLEPPAARLTRVRGRLEVR